MEGAVIASVAAMIFGTAWTVWTIRTFGDWRHNAPAPKDWGQRKERWAAYGFFLMSTNAGVGLFMFGMVSLLNHAGE